MKAVVEAHRFIGAFEARHTFIGRCRLENGSPARFRHRQFHHDMALFIMSMSGQATSPAGRSSPRAVIA